MMTVAFIAFAAIHLAFCWLVAVAAWCYGFWVDVGQLELAPAEVLGHPRLTSLADSPPLGTIAANLLLIPMGFILWQRICDTGH